MNKWCGRGGQEEGEVCFEGCRVGLHNGRAGQVEVDGASTAYSSNVGHDGSPSSECRVVARPEI